MQEGNAFSDADNAGIIMCKNSARIIMCKNSATQNDDRLFDPCPFSRPRSAERRAHSQQTATAACLVCLFLVVTELKAGLLLEGEELWRPRRKRFRSVVFTISSLLN
jgi:hypothetical protein